MAKIAQFNTSGYYANTCSHKGGYTTNSPTLETETTIEPVINNTDSSKYVIYVANSEHKKAYNSACLSYGEHFYFLCLLPSDGYISGWEGNNRYYVDHLTLNNSLYSNINYQMGQETKDGVTYYIPYNRYFGNTVITESIESDMPVFYDPEEFLNYVNNPYTPPVQSYTSNGGGATHIAKVTGQLKDLSSNLSDILIISGGGGGGMLVGETEYVGADAGGISGSGDNSADQSTGNAFGQGESGTDVSGGGSGLYGGYKGTSSKSGGAGSGYIGNSLVSNKKMVGYNVPTSSAESTKTESVNDVSVSPVSGKPKIGNGFARIKFLKGYRNIEFLSMLKTQDLAHRQTANNLGWYGGGVPSQLSQYLDSDWILGCGVHSNVAYLEQSGEEYILDGSQGHDTYMLYPVRNDLIGKRVSKVNIKALLYDTEGYSDSVFSNIIIINGNDSDEYYSIQAFNYNAGTSADRTIFALNTWYSFSVNVGNVILPDYIQMYVAVGKWKFKDIVFEIEE